MTHCVVPQVDVAEWQQPEQQVAALTALALKVTYYDVSLVLCSSVSCDLVASVGLEQCTKAATHPTVGMRRDPP